MRATRDYALVDRMAKTPAAVPRLLERVWGPAKAKAAVERDALAAMARSCGETHAHRALGLALLRREGAARALRHRRRRREALLRARPHARGRVRLREPPVRHPLRALPRRRGVPPGRARLRGAGRRRARSWACSCRTTSCDRPSAAARGCPPTAQQSRANGATADRRQQQQLREGARRRADAAVGRRRPHAVPRVRPRAARAAVAGDLRAPVGHQRAARLRRAALAALRALGVRAAGAAAARAACRRPARRSPTR